MDVHVVMGLSDVDPHEWDALAGDDDPFAEHAFLHTLELSGSVGEDSGWIPLHLLVRDEGRLIGALPLYLKEHSYGEYVFDWGWADGAARLRIPYYPKLVSMAPLTPATGRRVLIHPRADAERVTSALVGGLHAVADRTEASSIHLLYLSPEERDSLMRASREHGDETAFEPRVSMQYHWHAEGDATFDAFLARFRSSERKKVRKERRAVQESGLTIRTRPGTELDARDWAHLRRFYHDTCAKKGSHPYLADRFFDLAATRLAHRALAVFAYRDDVPVAATLSFEKGAHLYGRYWGCREDYEMLHFELCYYRLIERAIERGVTRFEAGAQGGHKLKRGLLPAEVHSLHWVRDPRLRLAVSDFLRREAATTRRHIAQLAEHGPFHREE